MSKPAIGIAGVGMYVPATYITGAEIARETGIPADVIVQKFGLARKPIPGLDDHPNAMALKAAQAALAQAGIAADAIDVVLCTTEEWKNIPSGQRASSWPMIWAPRGPGPSTCRCGAAPPSARSSWPRA